MTEKRATPRSGNYGGARGSVKPDRIIADWEEGTLLGGLLIAVSFGLMFIYAAVMF